MYKKIIKKCNKIAEDEDIELRQCYSSTIKKLAVDQRFRNHPKNQGKAKKADKKVKTIAGRLVRDIERKLNANSKYNGDLLIMKRVLQQKRSDKNKIYSLHEPEVKCISKGKEHKKYEFGNKVSIMSTKNTGVIIAAVSCANEYDGHTLEKTIEQQQRMTEHQVKATYVDRGYRGIHEVLGTKVSSPKMNSTDSKSYKNKLRKGFRRRAAIEPIISHLKSNYRINRNYYKGITGDAINVMLAAAAWNFKRMINKWKKNPLFDLIRLIIMQLNPKYYLSA